LNPRKSLLVLARDFWSNERTVPRDGKHVIKPSKEQPDLPPRIRYTDCVSPSEFETSSGALLGAPLEMVTVILAALERATTATAHVIDASGTAKDFGEDN
jgi:hypothetical protein